MESKPEEITLSGDGYLYPHSVALQPLAFIPKQLLIVFQQDSHLKLKEKQ